MTLLAYSQKFDAYQGKFTQDEIAYRLRHFLQKSKELEDQYLLTQETFQLFATTEDKVKNKPEFTLRLAKVKQELPQTVFPAALKNWRIAIDPGHLGGDFAILEQRYIKMILPGEKEKKQVIFFKEGTLALMTALLLKQWLEADGVEVLLTKEKDGQAVYETPFFEWLAKEGYKQAPYPIPGLQMKQTLSQLFVSYYNRLDLQARANKINAFHPHLTLIIHYNAHGGRDPITQENYPEKYNYNMVFIGGSFCKGELATPVNREEFLRLLLTNDLEESLRLSQRVIHQLTEKLHVPPVSSQDPVPYLASASLKVGNGIYARNLFLTRMVKGPLCYGETLCQDQREESLRLNERNLEIDHVWGPKRVEEVAKGYYEAVKAFINQSSSKLGPQNTWEPLLKEVKGR